MEGQKPEQMGGGEARLVADEEHQSVHFRTRSEGRHDPTGQGRAHPGVPFLIDDGFDGQPGKFRRHAISLKAQDDDDRGTARFERETSGAEQQAFSINLNELFWVAEARGGSGGEDDGCGLQRWSAARLRFRHG